LFRVSCRGADHKRYIDAFFRVLDKAFDHPEVIDRLLKNPDYDKDMYTPPATPDVPRASKMLIKRTAAMLEMLTGYKVELKTKESDYASSDVLKNDLAAGQGVDGTPTIVYDTDLGMRPIIMNTNPSNSADKPYRLLDCRVGGAMNFTGVPADSVTGYLRSIDPTQPYHGVPEAYDRFRSLEEVFGNVTWVLRLADQKTLNIADVDEGLKPLQASFDSYYYENGIPEQEYVTGPTSQVVVENAAQPSASASL
jgi:hypothetical protein